LQRVYSKMIVLGSDSFTPSSVSSFPRAFGGNPETLSTASANVQVGCPTKALGHDSTINQNGNCSRR
jgi:hypothetical protein